MGVRDLKTRSNLFAHDCVKLALNLPQNVLGNHIRKQLIRCATSTAANYRAASEENLLEKFQFEEILKEAKELTAIFVASRITAEKNLNKRD